MTKYLQGKIGIILERCELEPVLYYRNKFVDFCF